MIKQSSYKSRGGVLRLFNACRYSLNGFGHAIRHEAAFRQELALCIVLVPLAFYVGSSPIEYLWLLGSLVLVLLCELFNSALEALADAVTLEQHPLIGRAKDLGSAAVLLAILWAVAVWLAIIF